jgi:anti-sigma B factor antagonist
MGLTDPTIARTRKEPSMADAVFQHLRLSMVKDVAVVEIRTKEIHGLQLAQELGQELAVVIAQDWAKRVLVNFRRVAFLSSTGLAAIFKLVSRARVEGREVKLCNMDPGVRLGAEIVGLDKVAEIHDDEGAALRAFARARAVAGRV